MPKAVEFKCDLCTSKFTSKHHLRQHVEYKHAKPNIQMPIEVNCEFCGLITKSHQDMINHKRECNCEFIRVGNKVCKYFVNGGCFKGETCAFTHPSEKQFKEAPTCRNGSQCRYLANGVCSFYHRGIGIQRPRNQAQHHQTSPPDNSFQQSSTKRWCRFLEDCNRVPLLCF